MFLVKKILEEKLNTVYALLVEQKVEEVLDFYTDDCIFIPQGASEVKGKKGEQRIFICTVDFSHNKNFAYVILKLQSFILL